MIERRSARPWYGGVPPLTRTNRALQVLLHDDGGGKLGQRLGALKRDARHVEDDPHPHFRLVVGQDLGQGRRGVDVRAHVRDRRREKLEGNVGDRRRGEWIGRIGGREVDQKVARGGPARVV